MSSKTDPSDRRKVAITAELMRRGATLLNEACPRCGGIQIRFQGKVYCINEDDLTNVGSLPSLSRQESSSGLTEQPTRETVIPRNTVASSSATASPRKVESTSEHDALRALLEEKLANVSRQLESSQDFDQQEKLLDLISKYLETLEKLKTKPSVSE